MRLVEALRIVQQAPAGAAPFHVFLACGFTPLHLQTFLTAHLQGMLTDRKVELSIGLFGDVAGSMSRAADAAPDAVAVALEWSDFDPRLGLRQLGGWNPRRLDDFAATVRANAKRLRERIERMADVSPVAVSLPTLPLPPVAHNAGWESSSLDLSMNAAMAELSTRLAEHSKVRFLSRQRLDLLSPFTERFDVRSEVLSGFPYRMGHAAVLSELLAKLIKPPTPKKGIITDLDDTLWSGLLGEVGTDGVSWDLDRKSQMHGVYQQLLCSLAESGVLVAIASENDPARVAEALRREDLAISPDQIFPIKVHWGSKSESVGEILQAWNVGADSVVFVDDSRIELAEVQAVHPAVEGLHFPAGDEQAVYHLLEQLRDRFGRSRLSDEDALRLESLRAAAKLTEDSVKHGEASNDFLAQVEAEITIEFGIQPADARALELVNKTNQFNLNGRRYTENEWKDLLSDLSTFSAVVAYKDKYGPLGKIAVLCGRRNGPTVMVEAWVMSCRAFARRIEHRCLEILFERFDSSSVSFDFRATDRNAPTRDFLRSITQNVDVPTVQITRDEFAATCPPLFHHVKTIHHE